MLRAPFLHWLCAKDQLQLVAYMYMLRGRNMQNVFRKDGRLKQLESTPSQHWGTFSCSLVHMRGVRFHSCHWDDPNLGGESADIVYRKRIPGIQAFMRSTQRDTAQLSKYISSASIQHVARGVLHPNELPMSLPLYKSFQ